MSVGSEGEPLGGLRVGWGGAGRVNSGRRRRSWPGFWRIVKRRMGAICI